MDNVKETIVSQIKESLLTKTPYDGVGCLGFLEEAIKGTGFELEKDYDTNGWEVDFWTYIYASNGATYAQVSGSMYYGELNISYETN